MHRNIYELLVQRLIRFLDLRITYIIPYIFIFSMYNLTNKK